MVPRYPPPLVYKKTFRDNLMGVSIYDDTMKSLDYTYSFDKISCMKEVWYVHVMFAFLVILSGVACLTTRVVMKWAHPYFGRAYIICMLWCMGTSLVIHNTGLPFAVLLSFIST